MGGWVGGWVGGGRVGLDTTNILYTIAMSIASFVKIKINTRVSKMPPKKKHNQSDWHECTSCRCVVSHRDMTTHKDECRHGCGDLTHGYIKDGLIFSRLSDKSLTGTSKR